MSTRGLHKAYSSSVRLEKRGRKIFVVKTLSAEEFHNELFFYRELKRAKLLRLEVFEENGELFVEHAGEDVHTLGDHPTLASYERFGKLLREIHAIQFLTPIVVDKKGKERPVVWSKVIDGCLKDAMARQIKRKGFTKKLTSQIAGVIKATSIRCFDGSPTLLHCDLHQNNVLLKKKEVVIIDKGSAVAVGDPLYDLTMLPIVLPGSIYLNNKKDKAYLQAFMNGYGSDFTEDHTRLDAYVLLRCLERWPNPFEKEIPQIVSLILSSKNDKMSYIIPW